MIYFICGSGDPLVTRTMTLRAKAAKDKKYLKTIEDVGMKKVSRKEYLEYLNVKEQ